MNCSGDLKGLLINFIENLFLSEDDKDGAYRK